jgi:hypothetical protein
MAAMPENERTVQEPREYEEALERIRHIDSPVEQHNQATDLLLRLHRDSHLTDLPAYDEVADKILDLVHSAADRITEME